MQASYDNSSTTNISTSIVLFRILVAALIGVHGWARMLADAVYPFGGFLDAQGFPFGTAIAWAITLLEIVGTILIMVGSRHTPVLCVLFSVIYAAGIVMVHAPEGWFVVGLGRNGMEYSVLLIGSLLIVGHAHWHKGEDPDAVPERKNTDN